MNSKLLGDWKKAKLKDITEIITKGTTPTTIGYNYTNEGVNFVKIESITNNGKFLIEKMAHISQECNDKMIRSQLKENDIIFSIAGAIGRTAMVSKEVLPANTNQALAIIRLNTNEVSTEFLLKYLRSEYIFKQFDKKKQGVAQLNLSLKDISELEIMYPPISEQKEIVIKLNRAQKAIDMRKESIKLLDELVKSKFIEMFGEPVLNTKNWDVKDVIDVCDCMVPGRDKPKSFTGSTPWITIDDLNVNGITYKSKSNLGLTDEEINEVKRKKVPKGSVLMSCVGNLGICSIAGEEMIINQQLHSFQCKDINNFFLMYYLGFRKDYMVSQASSTTVLYMNKTVCNSIPVYLPPMELQNQFTDFVNQVDKLKFEMQKSLQEMENNFNSLMQCAFNGNLKI